MYEEIRIPFTFLRSRQRAAVSEELNVNDCAGYLVNLLLHTATSNGSDGVLRGMNVFDIAHAAGWEGDPNVFVDALLRAGVLYVTCGMYAVSDWHAYAPEKVALQ